MTITDLSELIPYIEQVIRAISFVGIAICIHAFLTFWK